MEPDGVDIEPYQDITRQDAREQLELPKDDDIVMYTGHLYRGKGVETLVEAAKGLDATVYIVGGYDEDIQRVKTEADIPDNVVFTGFVEPSKIPVYQVAADVLVAPYTSESRPWVSPLKLFEYMAAGRPIVASDRKVLQEVLEDGENAIIFEKDRADSLRNTLKQVLQDEILAKRLSRNAQEFVQKYIWERRAARILSKVDNTNRVMRN